MGKAVTRDQALELASRFTNGVDWGKLTAEQAQVLVDLKPPHLAQLYLRMLRRMVALVTPIQSSYKIKLGRSRKSTLLQRIKDFYLVSKSAEDLIRRKSFPMTTDEIEMDVVVLELADFTDSDQIELRKLLDPTWLASWSADSQDRINGHVIELLPADAAICLRDQYTPQTPGEQLFIACREPVPDADVREIFVVEHMNGREWLRTMSIHPNQYAYRGWQFVYHLKKIE